MIDSIYDPPTAPDNLTGARTLVLNGIMQSDLDARGFQILNLNTSNLSISPFPTQHAPAHQWYNGYNATSHLLVSTQPDFNDLTGVLNTAQKSAINRVGTILHGTWASVDGPIDGAYLPTVDFIRPPVGPFNMAQHRIENLKDPVNPQDAVNLRTVQVQSMGFQPKLFCKTSTPAGVNLGLFGLSDTPDDISLIDNDRVLVRQQTDPTQNGIYNAHAGPWQRSTDCDDGSDFVGATVWVQFGTLHANFAFYQNTPGPIVVGVSPISFIRWAKITPPVAGLGLSQSGLQIDAVGTPNRILVGTGIDIDPAYAGQTSITTVGTIGSGTWKGGVVDGQYGGTGVSNPNRILTLQGNLSTQILLPDLSPEDPAIGVGSTIHLQSVGSCTVTFPSSGTLATTADLATVLPPQGGNAGKVLKTDGINAFWG